MAECIKTKTCVRKRPTEFESKITPTANAHLMEALLDN